MSERAPAVSVIVPAYNSERYITFCLQSLVNQDLQDIEIICVNDGSTDSTLCIMQEFAKQDSRIRIIDKQNSGYGDSMNVAMREMRGTWMASVDADDWVPAHAYARFLEIATEYNLDFAKANRLSVSGEGEHKKMTLNPIGREGACYDKVINPSLNLWESRIKAGQPGLYRSEFLRSNGIFHNPSPGASFQDTGFCVQALMHGQRAMLVEEPLYYVRVDNLDSSTLDKSKVFCLCDEYDFIRNRALKMPAERQSQCLESICAMRFEGYRWNERRVLLSDLEQLIKREHDEFIELERNGELNRSFFQENDWRLVRLLIERPMEYYACCKDERNNQAREAEAQTIKDELRESKQQIARLEQRIRDIETSKSYRIASTLMWAPRRIKRRLQQYSSSTEDRHRL